MGVLIEFKKLQKTVKERRQNMTDLYLYVPEVCDGDFCPMNCDNCYKHDEALAAAEGEDRDD